MEKTPEEVLFNAQVAIFFEDTENPNKFYNEFKTVVAGEEISFDKELVLPIPDQEQTKEIPIVQLSSKDDTYKLTIARKRTDFYIFGDGTNKYNDIDKKLKNISAAMFKFVQERQIKIARIALLARHFIEISDPAKKIADSLLSSEFKQASDGEPYDAYARYTTRRTVQSVPINDYTSIEKINVIFNGSSPKDGIRIVRDLNSVPDRLPNEFTNDQYIGFIREVSNLVGDIMNIKTVIWQ